MYQRIGAKARVTRAGEQAGCLDSACVTLRSLESGANCIIGGGNYEQSGAASGDVNIQ